MSQELDALRRRLVWFEEPEPEVPWKHVDLLCWSIVGMNHYRQAGVRQLFVAMIRDGHCIQAEGGDTKALWDHLRAQARAINEILPRTIA